MSSFMDKQKKIEKNVVSGYRAVEDTVVSGYKKIEDAVVGSYKKVEDKFVETFLTPDDFSHEETTTGTYSKQQKGSENNE